MSQYPPPNSGPTRGSYGMMPNQYQQPQQAYATSSSMMPQTSVAVSHPQPIAPAPAAARPPVLRPMPAGGVMPQTGLPSPYSGSPMMPHQQSLLQDSEQPTHVVGSQGRRGILPSAPGRPAAATGTGAAKNTVIPQKDADGKFPCPHCTKTYLHAKHLKRHLLRHTGDRPYMCVLCRDTFSRSDILKRHFQKCSIRRGNPTGVSHLSHPQAHVKKQQQNAQKANEGDMGHMNGMTNMPGDNVVHPFGMVQIQDGMGNMANDQNQLSRSSSMSRMDDNSNRDRRSMTGGYNGDVSNSMSSNINPQLANFNMPPNQNGMPMYGASGSNQQSGLDWSQMFPQSGAHHAYVTQFAPNIGQNQTAIKTEPNLTSERTNGMPGVASNDVNDRSLFFSNWDTQPSTQNPYRQLSSQIHRFFYPSGTVHSSQTALVNDFFSPGNVRGFLESYTHFHVHFPFLHIPTFRIMEAYTGLIAAMCCIGACYSHRVPSSAVRETTNFLKIALERDCNLFASDSVQASFKFGNGREKKDIERFQALILVSTLLTWNGTPIQREGARRLFPLVADIARRFDLLQVRNDSSLCSIFHQPKIALEDLNPGSFDWAMWVEQEIRIRLMLMVYLFDVARGLYFNCDPQFDSFEIRLPLPADDAAWEAQSALDCAQALSLYGSEAARLKNPDGSQRSKQPELNLTLAALFHSSYQIHPGSTNLYGKFILIHAVLAQIRRAQIEGRLVGLDGSATPLSQNDWIIANGSDTGSANNSTNGTPVAGLSAQTYKTLCTALDKFKSYWDMDMAIQFPPSVSNPRRYGFCRDGIHFFWLAKWMLKNTQVADLQMAPDSRFRQVIQLLRSVKTWVMSDGASRGEELGSVSDIDNDYGLNNLTVDMAQLFKPLPSIVESPGMPTVKTEV
ncbi:hypothetical protein AAE478_001628 [Parahypoxylon ruwenzoriense]